MAIVKTVVIEGQSIFKSLLKLVKFVRRKWLDAVLHAIIVDQEKLMFVIIRIVKPVSMERKQIDARCRPIMVRRL